MDLNYTRNSNSFWAKSVKISSGCKSKMQPLLVEFIEHRLWWNGKDVDSLRRSSWLHFLVAGVDSLMFCFSEKDWKIMIDQGAVSGLIGDWKNTWSGTDWRICKDCLKEHQWRKFIVTWLRRWSLTQFMRSWKSKVIHSFWLLRAIWGVRQILSWVIEMSCVVVRSAIGSEIKGNRQQS